MADDTEELKLRDSVDMNLLQRLAGQLPRYTGDRISELAGVLERAANSGPRRRAVACASYASVASVTWSARTTPRRTQGEETGR